MARRAVQRFRAEILCLHARQVSSGDDSELQERVALAGRVAQIVAAFNVELWNAVVACGTINNVEGGLLADAAIHAQLAGPLEAQDDAPQAVGHAEILVDLPQLRLIRAGR